MFKPTEELEKRGIEVVKKRPEQSELFDTDWAIAITDSGGTLTASGMEIRRRWIGDEGVCVAITGWIRIKDDPRTEPDTFGHEGEAGDEPPTHEPAFDIGQEVAIIGRDASGSASFIGNHSSIEAIGQYTEGGEQHYLVGTVWFPESSLAELAPEESGDDNETDKWFFESPKAVYSGKMIEYRERSGKTKTARAGWVAENFGDPGDWAPIAWRFKQQEVGSTLAWSYLAEDAGKPESHHECPSITADEPDQPTAPDPGEGWRLLERGETIQPGDEIDDFGWRPVEGIIGGKVKHAKFRRRITPEKIPTLSSLRGMWKDDAPDPGESMTEDRINRIRESLCDPKSPLYGSDLVPLIADLCDAFESPGLTTKWDADYEPPLSWPDDKRVVVTETDGKLNVWEAGEVRQNHNRNSIKPERRVAWMAIEPYQPPYQPPTTWQRTADRPPTEADGGLNKEVAAKDVEGSFYVRDWDKLASRPDFYIEWIPTAALLSACRD